jgi:hypothetical protein
MKNKIVLFSALLFAVSLKGQLLYTSDLAAVSPYDGYKADAPFVSGTLLNLGLLNTFTKSGLTFNLIPNLSPISPSDLRVGAGFTADVKFLAESHADSDVFGGEQNLLGLGNQVLYNFGPASNTTWHITAAAATDLIFWTQDNSFGPATKFDMADILHFRTFTAADLLFTYYIFALDDRGSQLVDYNDGVVGVRINNRPVGLESVPEPSTFGIIGGAALLGIVALRRIKRQSSAIA